MPCPHLKKQRLDKTLADAGVETRSRLKELIRSGQVRVDGAVCRDPAAKICPRCAAVSLRGAPVALTPWLYLMLNKPAGVISATEDRRQNTVLDLLPEAMRHRGLFPVGRLDKDTVGLLILTNDGPLGHALTAPRRHRDKVYLARVDGRLDPADREAFARGMVLRDGTRTAPAELEILAPDLARVTLREGKYHQVKRMLAARGKPVTALERVEMAGLRLDPALPRGGWRPLTEAEICLLKKDTCFSEPEKGPDQEKKD